jgi:hypothetical protein
LGDSVIPCSNLQMIKIPEIGIQLDAAIIAKYSYAKLAAKSFGREILGSLWTVPLSFLGLFS